MRPRISCRLGAPQGRVLVGFVVFLGPLLPPMAATGTQQDRRANAPIRRGDERIQLHGRTLADPYRWMEDTRDSTLMAWVRTEDEATDAFVRGGVPFDRIRARLAELLTRSGAFRLPQPAGARLFYWEAVRRDGRMAADLYYEERGSDPAGVLAGTGIDAMQIMDYRPSPSGSHVAVAMRAAPGSDWLIWRIVAVDDRTPLPETLEGAFFPRTDLVWGVDDHELFYTRFDGPDPDRSDQSGLAHHVVRRHRLGTDPTSDPTVFAPDSTRDWSLDLDRTDDGRYLVVAARIGNAIDATIHVGNLGAPDPDIRPVILGPSASYIFLGSEGDRLYLRTDLHAERGRIVAVDLARPSVLVDIVPEQDDLLLGNSVWGGQPRPLVIGGRLVLPYQRDLRTELRIHAMDGRALGTIDTPAGGMLFAASGGNPITGSPDRTDGYYRFIGITDPNAVFRFDVESMESRPFLRPTVAFDPNRFTSELVFYESKDGTRIPMTLTYRTDIQPRSNRPVWLLVYGSGGFVMNPFFQGSFMAWLEMGGVHAIAHVRGGGAYGRPWHEAGIKRNKQTGIDDYIAAADWLVREGYTSPGRVVLNAVSAGGLLTSAFAIQRPDIPGAVLSEYPVTDVVGLTSGRGGGDWTPEYGDPADPEEFAAMIDYSPYHNAVPGTCYPPTLLLTSDADDLAPHAYKLVAALRHAQACDRPIMLQMAWGSAHASYGSQQHSPVDTFSEQIAWLAKVMELDLGDLIRD